nr:MAG TPA: ATP grasp ligase [Caudoviricetes sp.]
MILRLPRLVFKPFFARYFKGLCRFKSCTGLIQFLIRR